MNDLLSAMLLLSVPGLPLLLAFPVLRSRLPWFRYFALLPAAIVALAPLNYSVELPWLLFGSQLSIDGVSRLLLGVSVLLWLAAASLISKQTSTAENPQNNYQLASVNPVFFLLTMAGSFGAILANDLVSFFVSSTLMGYAFYGLLVTDTTSEYQAETRRAGRIYLVAMIVADIVLFEVLLIAALVSDNLSFAVLHQNIAASDSLSLYLWLVLIGFGLKIGLWPLHFWLVAVLRYVRPTVALLLCAVPVSIALLGILRWLPLGEITPSKMGLIVQATGVLSVVYAISFGLLAWLKKKPKKAQGMQFILPSSVMPFSVVLLSGLFIIAIGAALTDAAAIDTAIANHYENSLYIFIAVFILGLAASLVTIRAKTPERSARKNNSTLASRKASTVITVGHPDTTVFWFERYSASVVLWGNRFCRDTLPRWRDTGLTNRRYLWLQVCRGKKMLKVYEDSLRGWSLAITLFLSLLVIIFFIVMFQLTADVNR